MSQTAQPVKENTSTQESKAEEVIKETLEAFDITPEKAEMAKKIGLPIDKIALYVGMQNKRMEVIEKAIIQISEGVKPAIDLSKQIAEARAAQSQQPQGQPQPQSGNIGGLLQIFQAAAQSGLLGERRSDIENKLMDGMMNRMIAQISQNPDEEAFKALDRYSNILAKGITIGARGRLGTKEIAELSKVTSEG